MDPLDIVKAEKERIRLFSPLAKLIDSYEIAPQQPNPKGNPQKHIERIVKLFAKEIVNS